MNLILPQKFALMWERITVSRLTVFYFIFSILHCVVQVVLLVRALGINQEASSLLSGMITQGNATIEGFTVLGAQLRLCQTVPHTLNQDSCQVVWAGTPFNQAKSNATSSSLPGASTVSVAEPSASTSAAANNVAAVVAPVPSLTATVPPTSIPLVSQALVAISPLSSTGTTTVLATPTSAPPSTPRLMRRAESGGTPAPINIDGQATVMANGLGFHHQVVSVSRKCLLTLNWPEMILENTTREDITFVAFQFWLLGMSIVALLNESIPHIAASLTTHFLATALGAYQVVKTAKFRTDTDRLISNGACGENFLQNYWSARSNAEIPSLALNVGALLISAFLSWRLIKLFGWQTFKRMGASITINRVYKVVLSHSITIQLALFFLVVGMGLWIDQLCNGFIARHAEKATVYKVMIGIICVLLVPWLMLAWYGTRRENKIMMHMFLFMSIFYVGGWIAMLDSYTFRWTFVTWVFFAIVIVFGIVLTLVVFALGIVCRLNFGKGLPEFLNQKDDDYPDDDEFVPVKDHREADPEKGEKAPYPTLDTPVPTFSLSFGDYTSKSPTGVAPPPNAITRTPSSPMGKRSSLRRQDTSASTASTRSLGSRGSIKGGGSSRSNSVRSRDQRWVIE